MYLKVEKADSWFTPLLYASQPGLDQEDWAGERITFSAFPGKPDPWEEAPELGPGFPMAGDLAEPPASSTSGAPGAASQRGGVHGSGRWPRP